jgi:hypothetical protein
MLTLICFSFFLANKLLLQNIPPFQQGKSGSSELTAPPESCQGIAAEISQLRHLPFHTRPLYLKKYHNKTISRTTPTAQTDR